MESVRTDAMVRKDCDSLKFVRLERPIRAGRCCLLVVCCAASARAQSVNVLPAALVDRDHIRLADMAILDGFSDEQLVNLQTLVIAPAPDFGQNTSISLDLVREKLSGAGANLALIQLKGASACVLRRPLAQPAPPSLSGSAGNADPVNPESLRAGLVRYLEDKLKDYAGRLDVDFGRTPQELLDLSGPDLNYQIDPVDGNMLGAVELRITIRQAQGQAHSETVAVNAALWKPVVVVAAAVHRGQILTASDLSMEERCFRKLSDIGLAELQAAIGQEARRNLRVGDVLGAGDIKSRILVKRNELVRIRCMSGGIELAATATAQQSGSLGDVIEVLNNASGKTFWAKVTGLRQALVIDEPFEPLSAALAPGESR